MKKLLLGFALLAIAGCGSDGGSSSSSSGATKDKFGNCYGGEGQECTGIDDYTNCVMGKCDAEYKDMLGDDYMNGNWGGMCKTYMECNIACACGDTSCNGQCLANVTQDCKDAIDALATCVQNSGCAYPKCGTTGGTGGADCDALKACCDQITIAAIKSTCDSAAALGNNDVCKANLASWQAGQLCN